MFGRGGSKMKYKIHECEEWVSQCCGAGRHEYVEDVCGKCLEHTGFECMYCGKLETELCERKIQGIIEREGDFNGKRIS